VGQNDPDVRIKLMLDDGATKDAVEGMRRGLQDSNEELEKGEGHAQSILKELLKFEAIKEGAKLFAEGMRQAWEMGEKLVEAATETTDEMNQQVRAASGLMMFMDKGAHSLGQIREYAAGLREDLKQSGTQTGVSTSAMMEAYDRIIERGGRSTEQAKELTEQMALVGKIVPRGMEGIAEGFNMMELGIVRARNPLVQLIASTGILKGNAHDIARQMQHMLPEKQIEIAQKAIAKQAELMKAGGAGGVGPPTLEELRSSFGNIREGFLEAVGKPIMDRVLPALAKLRDWFASHSGEIEAFGERVGEKIAEIFAKVEEIGAGAYAEWREISGELRAAGDALKEAWAEVAGSNKDQTHDLKDAALTFAAAVHLAADAIRESVEFVKNLYEFLVKSVPRAAGHLIMSGLQTGAAPAWGSGVAQEKATRHLTDQAKEGKVSTEEFAKTIEDYSKVMKDAGMSVADVMATVREAQGNFAANARGEDLGMLKEDMVENWMGQLVPKEKITNIEGHGPVQNFYGGIHIKQDFRDQDPDRVVDVFRRDLVNQATNRRQSRLATFGGL
jgi:hypothetical protein